MLQGRAITWPNSRFHPAWTEESPSIPPQLDIKFRSKVPFASCAGSHPPCSLHGTDSHLPCHLPGSYSSLSLLGASLSKKKAFVNLICTLSFMSAGELSEKFQFVVVLDRYFVHILIEIVRKQWQLWWKCTRNWLQKATVKNINLWAFT